VTAARFPDRLRAISCHQLTPELAEAIAVADRVVFVDATLDLPAGTPPRVERLEPDESLRGIGHALHPAGLLDLARTLCGRAPAAWLIAIPVASMELGEPLSPAAQAGVAFALDQIGTLCHPDHAP